MAVIPACTGLNVETMFWMFVCCQMPYCAQITAAFSLGKHLLE